MIPYADGSKPNPIEEENEIKIKWYDKMLLHRPSKVVVALLLTAVVLPIILYELVLSSTLDLPPPDGYSFGSCLVSRTSRLLCGRGKISQSECHPQCCYDLANGMCFHRHPSRFSYLMDRPWTEGVHLNPRIANEPFSFQQSLTNIRLSIDEVSTTHISMTFYSIDTEPKIGRRLNKTNYSYEVTSPELNIEVKSRQGTIFNTFRGPLIAANDIWEITFKLTDEVMFGLGEIPLQRDTSKVLYAHKGGFSSIPLIFAKSNGSYHGLLLSIEAPTEVNIGSENQVIVRSITWSGLKFHVFVGPEPKDVLRDVSELIGFENAIQYWMLGAHVCNSFPEQALEETYNRFEDFVKLSEAEQLPFDSHCGIAPLTMNNGFGDHNDNGLEELKQINKRYLPHLSPYVRYSNETEDIDNFNYITQELKNALLQHPSTDEVYIGTVKEAQVVYPDYENPSAQEILKAYLNKSISNFDGLILENNWPLDESFKLVNETQFYLPYFDRVFNTAFNLTPPWNVTRYNIMSNRDRYLYSHNTYGNNFYRAIKNISHSLPISTSSQWLNGRAIINRQGVDASWANLRKELTEASLGGISGHRLWSSPVCGDTDNFDETHTSLCLKWYMSATYFPLLKIHSTSTERHPLAFVGSNRIYMIEALKTRMSLLPYFFTVLQEGPLLRPMFFQYPQVESLEGVTTQFCVGDDLLVVPSLLPSQSHIHVRMPPGSWYELWSGLRIDADEGQLVTMAETDADFLTLLRAGSILFLQKNVKSTAEETRLQSSYTIIIAYNCTQNAANQQNCMAKGNLYLTRNMTITIEADLKNLTIRSIGDEISAICDPEVAVSANSIREINIYGLSEELNNYDHHRRIETALDLCRLSYIGEIITPFTDWI